jgi:TonB-dependent starch-binding outer membrane protein SusC
MQTQIALSVSKQGFEITNRHTLIKIALLLFVLTLTGKATFAQTSGHIVRGTVVANSDNSTMPGVNILLIGTTTGTTTDANGQFEFPKRLVEGDQLLFSFLNTASQTHTVKGTEDETLMIRLEDTVVLIEPATAEVYTPKKSRRVFAAFRNK